jgi:hypothetical protein
MRGRVPSALIRRRRVRLDLLLGALVVLAVAAVILVQGTASSQSLAPVSPQPAAVAFAQAYLGYLDGRLPARSLPDATDQVRTIAGGSPPIPAGARQGTLKPVQMRVTYVRGALTGQAAVLGRDGAHAYGFTVELRYLNGRWQVVYLIPPDVYTISATPHGQPAPPERLQRTAAAFALAYVAYREGTQPSPPPGLPTIEQQIAARRDPLGAVAPSHVAPRLVSVLLGPAVDGAASASAVLSDGGRKLRFAFDLKQSAGGWQAWGFPEGG